MCYLRRGLEAVGQHVKEGEWRMAEFFGSGAVPLGRDPKKFFQRPPQIGRALRMLS